MTNYNENGATYKVQFDNSAVSVGGYLKPKVQLLKQAMLSNLYQVAKDESQHDWVREYLGAIHHLDGFLVSVERLVENVEFVKKNAVQAKPLPQFPRIFIKQDGMPGGPLVAPVLIGMSSRLIEIEVETCLLRAVSLLERLTSLAQHECNLPKVKSFFYLESILTQLNGKDNCCAELADLIDSVKADFFGVILSDGKSAPLRNIIAHKNSTPEIMDTGFTINVLPDGRSLLFDAEVEGYPLVATVRNIAEMLPYFALNFLRILLHRKRPSQFTACYADNKLFNALEFVPEWDNPFIHYSLYIDPNKLGPIVSTVKWMPGGFKPQQDHLLNEVFDLAIKL